MTASLSRRAFPVTVASGAHGRSAMRRLRSIHQPHPSLVPAGDGRRPRRTLPLLMEIVLETARLVLREIGMDDLPFIADMLGDKGIMYAWPRPYTVEEAEGWIRRQQARYARDGYGYWLVLEKDTQQPVGQVGLLTQVVEGEEEVGLGYLMHRDFWRQGIAEEASEATLAYAFERLNLPRVIALVQPTNAPSLGLARKLGMKEEGRMRYVGLDHLIFAIQREDWVRATSGAASEAPR